MLSASKIDIRSSMMNGLKTIEKSINHFAKYKWEDQFICKKYEKKIQLPWNEKEDNHDIDQKLFVGLCGGKSVRCFPGIESSEPISKVRDWIAGIIETAIHLTNAILKSYYSIQSPYPFTCALYDEVDRKSWKTLLKTPNGSHFAFFKFHCLPGLNFI